MTPVVGCTATASWAKRPRNLSGTVAWARLSAGSGETSKTQPWSTDADFPASDLPPARSSVSSQVSHVPHGVTPPAQLFTVPATPTYCDLRAPRESTAITVQPPPA